MADVNNGALSFVSTMDNDQMIAAIDETLRRIQGLSDGTVEGTMQMSDAFSATADGVRNALSAIDAATSQHQTSLDGLRSEYDRLGKERARAFAEGREEEMRSIQESINKVKGEITVRESLVRELDSVGGALRTNAQNLLDNAHGVENTANATQSLKAQIRELKAQMADMVMNGIDQQSEAYVRLRNELGRLQDIQGDIQKQGSVLANDEAAFQGIMSGFQGVAGAASMAAGAYALFGEENEDLQKIMLKVQSLMSITMGMQQVAQTLNKDSAFMLTTVGGLKNWWAGIVQKATKADVANTAATKANTVALGENAGASSADAVAQEANTAARNKNTGSVTAQNTALTANIVEKNADTTASVAGTAANLTLAGAFRAVGAAIKSIPVFGWVIAGITAVVGLMIHFKNRADEAKKAAVELSNKVAESAYKPIGNIEYLSLKWDELGDNLEAKERFVRENQTAFKELGIAVDSVTAAETALVQYKSQFIAAQIAKAKATILLEQAMVKLREAMQAKNERDAENQNSTKLGWTGFYNPWDKKNEEYKQKQKESDELMKQAAEAEAEGWEIMKAIGVNGAENYADGTVGAIEQAIEAKRSALKHISDPKEYQETEKDIARMQAKIDKIKGASTKSTSKASKASTSKAGKTPEEERAERIKKALDAVRTEYERFYAWMNSGDAILVEQAKTEFKGLTQQGATYIDYLKKQREQLMAISADKRTAEQSETLAAINEQIAEEARDTVLETFNKELNAQLSNAKSIADMLNVIEARRKELANDGTELDTAKKTSLDESEQRVREQAKSEYAQMLSEYGTFEEKKAQLAEEFAKKRAIAEANGNKEMLTALDAAEKEALSKFALDEMMKSPDWELMFGNLDEVSTKKLEELLTKINGMTAYLGVEFAPEDLAKLKEAINKMKDEINQRNPFKALKDAMKDYSKATDAESKKKALVNVFESASAAADIVVASVKGISDCMAALGVESDSEAAAIVADLAKIGEGASQIAQGIASGNPISIIQGSVSVLTAAFDMFNFKDRAAERQIKKHQKALKELQSTYQQLEWAIDKALGADVYSGQKIAIRNMESQIAELEAAIKAEDSKKKTDKDRISEWQEQIAELQRNIADMYDEIAKDILQTDAKDFADELGDALAEAFGQGEDAAKAFEQTVNNVLKNAIINQLKKNFLEKQLQSVLSDLENSMGYWVGDDFHFDGLDEAEIAAFRERVGAIADTYNKALESYKDIFSSLDSADTESSLVGAVKGVTEETAEIISGQMQAIRISQAENTALMRNALEDLARIAANTSYNHHLQKLERIVSLLESSDGTLRASGIQV